MIRELKQKWDSLPWWMKLLVVLTGLMYISGRKGLFWKGVRAFITLVGVLLLYPVFLAIYFLPQIYYMIPKDLIFAVFIGGMVLFFELFFYIIACRRKKRRKGY